MPVGPIRCLESGTRKSHNASTAPENSFGVNVMSESTTVQIGFCKAAELGDIRALRVQLARGASKNGTNHQNDTAILLAAATGQTDTVRRLLKWGVKFDEYSHETWCFGTPMHAAAARGHAGVVALLLKAGADKLMSDRTHEITIRGIGLTSVWEEASAYPAVMQVLKADRARKNWSRVRSPKNMNKVKMMSICWYWFEQAARRHTEPDPEGIAFMQAE